MENKNNGPGQTVGSWLEERCQKGGLSLRQAAQKTGLSHTTIADIIKGKKPAPETIKNLAAAFGGDGDHQRRTLEDKLFTLAGYRSERPQEAQPSEPMARLLDQLSQLDEPQLKVMSRFADFIAGMRVTQ